MFAVFMVKFCYIGGTNQDKQVIMRNMKTQPKNYYPQKLEDDQMKMNFILQDVAYFDKTRYLWPIWENLLVNTKGIVFTVNLDDWPNIEDFMYSIDNISQVPELKHVIFLIFCTRTRNENTENLAKINEKLNNLNNRRWQIQQLSLASSYYDGIIEGIKWLSNEL
ncbi:unnamed protein product [Diamesa tonsa]